MKEVRTIQKYIRMPARKLRMVVFAIKEVSPEEALEKLPFVEKAAAKVVEKALKAAIANARGSGLSGDLAFKSIQVNEGPTYKTGRFVSRGAWHPVRKKMSHLRIVLVEEKKEGEKPKEGKKKVTRAVGGKETKKKGEK